MREMTSALMRQALLLLAAIFMALSYASAQTPTVKGTGETSGDRLTRPQAELLYAETVRQFSADKDLAKARTRLLEIIRHDPEYAAPRFHLGLFAEAEEDWSGAIKWFEDFLKLEPTSAQAARVRRELAYARRAMELDRTPEGKRKRKYEEAVAWASSFASIGLFKEAVAKAAEAAKIDASRWEAFALTARVLYQQKVFEDAIAFLQMAIERAPKETLPTLQSALAKYREESRKSRK